jgi:phosphoglycolate phosphatase-like HAD superfamily hydrolase
MPNYIADQKHAMAELEAAIAELKQAESKVASARQKLAALTILANLGSGQMGHFVKPSIAESIRDILASATDSLTVREIRELLRQRGEDLAQQVNPASTIGSVCARLVDQGFARRVHKGKFLAWVKK